MAKTSISSPALDRAPCNATCSPLSQLSPHGPTPSLKTPSGASNNPAPHRAITSNKPDSVSQKASTPVDHMSSFYEQPTRDKREQSPQAVDVNNSNESSSRQVSDIIDDGWIPCEVRVRRTSPCVSPAFRIGPPSSHQYLGRNRSQPRPHPLAISTTSTRYNRTIPGDLSDDDRPHSPVALTLESTNDVWHSNSKGRRIV